METKNLVKAFTTELNLTEKGFAELIERKEGLVIDVTTDAGFKLARKERTEMSGIHKNIDRLAIDGKKSIDEVRQELKDRVTAVYAPIVDAFEVENLKRKEEAERKAKAEAERIAGIQSRIDGIRGMVAEAKGKNSADISDIIEAVDLIDPADNFQDLTQEAAQAIKETLIELNGMLSTAIMQEQMQREREELRKEREELEALRAEKAAFEAEKAKAEREAKEAQERAEREAQEATASIQGLSQPEELSPEHEQAKPSNWVEAQAKHAQAQRIVEHVSNNTDGLKHEAYEAQKIAEKKWYAYACELPLGKEQEWAFGVYEQIRLSVRGKAA